MMRKKQILILFLTLSLVMPSFLVHANSNRSSSEEETPKTAGQIAAKDEVVYATLSPAGTQQDIYVVNIFDVRQAGEFSDFGPYTSLKNLTDLSDIQQKDDKVEFSADKGKFYYQGNMEDEKLPWDIKISYYLDGKEISPEQLPGKDGRIKIGIHTSANAQVDPSFFENYLLQISLTLDPDVYRNIEASGGMIANAGENKQVTFTVMPEKEGEVSLEADVIEFELTGIEIAAVPSSMSIDAPDIDEMTGDMESLADAITKVNNGVGELKNGVNQLNDGVVSLRDGSKQYSDGLVSVNRVSSELAHASLSIKDTLTTISNSIGDSPTEMDFSELTQLSGGLIEVANGLNDMANGLNVLKENYSAAYSTLGGAITSIPDSNITNEQIQSLYASGADHAVVDQLVRTYSAAQTAKGTYLAVKQGFDAIGATIGEVSGSIKEVEKTLRSTADGISVSLGEMDQMSSLEQLKKGLATLATKYGEFHSGLVGYTDGVSQLSNSYQQIHSGIVELAGGTGELENGVGELHNGTDELYHSTEGMPDQMKEEIDKMISEYDKSGFEAVSFVSSKNEKVNSVQFVIKTEGILKAEQETPEEPIKEQKSFWDRLLDLFKNIGTVLLFLY